MKSEDSVHSPHSLLHRFVIFPESSSPSFFSSFPLKLPLLKWVILPLTNCVLARQIPHGGFLNLSLVVEDWRRSLCNKWWIDSRSVKLRKIGVEIRQFKCVMCNKEAEEWANWEEQRGNSSFGALEWLCYDRRYISFYKSIHCGKLALTWARRRWPPNVSALNG